MSQRGKYKAKDVDDDKYGKGKPASLPRNAAGPLERGRKPAQKAPAAQPAKPAAPKKPEFNPDNLKHKFDMLSRKAEGDDLKFDENKVKNVMDKLAFTHQTKEVKSALWGFGTGLTQEGEATMLKAQETLHLIAASKHAAKWVPSEVSFAVKATYVKVSTEAVNRLKFYEHNKVNELVMQHAVEKQQILDENQGLRQMLKPYITDIEESSALVKDLRETEDGINRALLMSAHTEIVRLKSREADLEKQLSNKSLAARGLAAAKGDTKGENELKEEIARLEEKNSRLQWLVEQKETEIEDLRTFYTASKAYELQEELQEVCETLDGTVAALQAMDAANKQDMAEFQEDFETRVEDMEDQIATLEEDLDKVRSYVKECEAKADEKVNRLRMLKNAVVEYIKATNVQVQTPLVPDICALLELNAQEGAAVREGHKMRLASASPFASLFASFMDATTTCTKLRGAASAEKSAAAPAPPTVASAAAAPAAAAPTTAAPSLTPPGGASAPEIESAAAPSAIAPSAPVVTAAITSAAAPSATSPVAAADAPAAAKAPAAKAPAAKAPAAKAPAAKAAGARPAAEASRAGGKSKDASGFAGFGGESDDDDDDDDDDDYEYEPPAASKPAPSKPAPSRSARPVPTRSAAATRSQPVSKSKPAAGKKGGNGAEGFAGFGEGSDDDDDEWD